MLIQSSWQSGCRYILLDWYHEEAGAEPLAALLADKAA
jgi:hypothetical protein